MSIIDQPNTNSFSQSIKNVLFATLKSSEKGNRPSENTWTPTQRNLIYIVLVLNIFGIAMILSAGSVVASQEGIGEFSYAMRQSIWFILGLGALYSASKFDYRNLKVLARPLLYGTYFLMFLLYTPLGVQGGGATRWIAISGISFQPSEILKIATVILTAQVISDYQKDLRNKRAYGEPFFALFPAMVMLFFQPDYGRMCLIFFVLG